MALSSARWKEGDRLMCERDGGSLRPSAEYVRRQVWTICGAGHLEVESHLSVEFLLGLQQGDVCNKKIKKITISKRTLLAFRYKLYGDFEQ